MDAVCTLMNDGATRHTERESKPGEGEAARGGGCLRGAYEGLKQVGEIMTNKIQLH